MPNQVAGQPVAPAADGTGNTTVADVVGNKTDAAVTAVGTTKTLEAYAKGAITMSTVGVADAVTNAWASDVVGNKTDAAVTAVGTTKSIEAYAKGLVTMNTVQSADSTNNAFAGDVIGNKTDATQQTVGTTRSIMAYTKGLMNALIGAGATTFPAAAAPADTVTLGGALREMFNQMEKTISTITPQTMPQATTTIFVVAGGSIEILNLTAHCVTANNTNGSTFQWTFDATTGTATTLTGLSGSLASTAIGDFLQADLTILTTVPLLLSTGISAMLGPTVTQRYVLTNATGGNLQIICGTAATTGTWSFGLRYRPIGRGVTVTAAF